MRAAEHQRIYPRLHEPVEITRDHLVRHRVVEPSLLDQWHEQRAGLARHGDLILQRMDRPLIRAAVDRCTCSDHPDSAVARRSDRSPRARLDHTHDGHIEKRLHLRNAERRGGVAGDHDHLRAFRQQQPADLHAVAFDGLGAPPAVGHARGVADVEDVLRRQQLAQRRGDCEPADAGVEDTDGARGFLACGCLHSGGRSQKSEVRRQTKHSRRGKLSSRCPLTTSTPHCPVFGASAPPVSTRGPSLGCAATTPICEPTARR